MLVLDDPVGVDEVRLGHAVHAVGDGGLRVYVDEGGVGAASVAVEPGLHRLVLVLVDDADELDVVTVPAGCFDEVRVL